MPPLSPFWLSSNNPPASKLFLTIVFLSICLKAIGVTVGRGYTVLQKYMLLRTYMHRDFQTARAYNNKTLVPEVVCAEIESADEEACFELGFISDEVIAEFQNWVGVPGNTRSRAALLHQTVDTFWLIKNIAGKALVECSEAYNGLGLQLDEIQNDRALLREILMNQKIIDQKLNYMAKALALEFQVRDMGTGKALSDEMQHDGMKQEAGPSHTAHSVIISDDGNPS